MTSRGSVLCVAFTNVEEYLSTQAGASFSRETLQ